MAKKRPNVIPIIEDARHPARYRMLMPMVRPCFQHHIVERPWCRPWRAHTHTRTHTHTHTHSHTHTHTHAFCTHHC